MNNMEFGYVRVPLSTRFHTILMHDGVDYEPRGVHWRKL